MENKQANINKSNEKKIFLSQFESKVKDGLTQFVILDAKYDEIKTKKGEDVDVLKLTLELADIADPSITMEIKDDLMFINYSPRGPFYSFIKAVLEATSSTAFTPSLLLGIKGRVELSHYQPEGAEFAYPRLSKWVFNTPSEKVNEALKKYEDEAKNDEIDIDF